MRKINVFCLVTTFMFISCSREETTITTIPTPPVNTDPVTTQNVKTYMVDKNATTETAALFYNLRNLGKTKIVIGQHDAFNSFYPVSYTHLDVYKRQVNQYVGAEWKGIDPVSYTHLDVYKRQL